MRDSINGVGIVSYAGLRLDELLVCLQQNISANGDRLHCFLPLFPAELIQTMPYVGKSGRCATDNGFSVDPLLYHMQLYREMPELYTGENAVRCIRGDDFISTDLYVDQAWIEHFPQFSGFLGEKLYIRLIGGGCQGVAVPQSLFPIGAEWLSLIENKLGITQSAQRAAFYIGERIRKGYRGEIRQLESEYVKETGLCTCWVRQSDVEHFQKNRQYVKKPLPLIFPAETAFVPQYLPSLVACDSYSDYHETPFSQKLAQLYYDGDDYVSDFWFPWKQAWTLGDLKRMAIDAGDLCRGYQVPPRATADGAVYPNTLRVVSVNTEHLKMKIAEISANSCYGTANLPTGAGSKLIYIPNSKELIDKGWLCCESLRLLMRESKLTQAEWLKMRQGALAAWQLGRLNDQLVARDRVLNGLDLTMPGVSEALEPFSERVEALEKELAPNLSYLNGPAMEQRHYLQRKYRYTTGVCEVDLPYFRNERIESCAEAFAAMHAALPVYDWRLLCRIEAEDGEDMTDSASGKRKKGRPPKRKEPLEMEQISFIHD